MKSLRETEGVCLKCFARVPAGLVLNELDEVVLQKRCPVDGPTEDLVTGHGRVYAEIDAFYQRIMKPMKQASYFLEINSSCNLSCKFCYLKDKDDSQSIPDLPISEIPAEHIRGKTIDIIGAEPTLSPSLLDKVRDIRRIGGKPQLSTNGLRLRDREYAAALRSAGIDRVSLQFDSLSDDYYREHCGMPLAEKKIEAVRSLTDQKIPVTLRMVVIRGSNDTELWPMVDFVQRDPYTISVSFFGLSKLGMALENYPERSLMPLDIMQLFCDQSKGRVAIRDLVVLLKSFYLFTAIREIKWCLHIYPFVLLRDGDSYVTYTAVFDRDKLDRELDRLSERFDRVKRRANLPRYLLAHLKAVKLRPLARLAWRHRRLIPAVWRHGIVGLFREFTAVNFQTICSPDMTDFNVISNCNRGAITRHPSVPLVTENVGELAYLRDKQYRRQGATKGLEIRGWAHEKAAGQPEGAAGPKR